MAKIYESDAQKRQVAETCAAALARTAYTRGTRRLELEVLGLKQNNVAIGDWKVTIECMNLPGHDC